MVPSGRTIWRMHLEKPRNCKTVHMCGTRVCMHGQMGLTTHSPRKRPRGRREGECKPSTGGDTLPLMVRSSYLWDYVTRTTSLGWRTSCHGSANCVTPCVAYTRYFNRLEDRSADPDPRIIKLALG